MPTPHDSMNQIHIFSALLGGAIVLVIRSLLTATARDVTRRLALSALWIKIWDVVVGRTIGLLLQSVRHPVWSGRWTLTWEVESTNFQSINSQEAPLFVALDSVCIEGVGKTAAGGKLAYTFVGRLTRDKCIVTGAWTDKVSGPEGYHGVFQLRLNATKDEARGLWVGFSHGSEVIKSGVLVWKKEAASVILPTPDAEANSTQIG